MREIQVIRVGMWLWLTITAGAVITDSYRADIPFVGLIVFTAALLVGCIAESRPDE